MTVTSRHTTSATATPSADPGDDLARLFESLTAPATQMDSYRSSSTRSP